MERSAKSPPDDTPTESPAKRLKVTSACELCRRKKIKCDGTPPCDPCIKAGTTCVFDKPPRKRGPRKTRMLQSSSPVAGSSKPVQLHTRSVSENTTAPRYGYQYTHPLSPRDRTASPLLQHQSSHLPAVQPYYDYYQTYRPDSHYHYHLQQGYQYYRRPQYNSHDYHQEASPRNVMMPPPAPHHPQRLQRLEPRELPIPTGLAGHRSIENTTAIRSGESTSEASSVQSSTPTTSIQPSTPIIPPTAVVLIPTADGLTLSSVKKDFESISRLVLSWAQTHSDERLVESIKALLDRSPAQPSQALMSESMKRLINELPDHVRDILMDDYFSVQRITNCPILNEVIFRARVGSGDIPAPITFFAALAIGAQMTKEREAEEYFKRQLPLSLNPSKDASKYFFLRAKHLFLRYMDKVPFCIGYLQGCLMLTLYLRLWLCLDASWVFLRHGLSVCQLLGYTRESGISRYNPIWKQEERRRATWIALGLDCAAVLCVDKEPTLEYDRVTCKMPSVEDGDSDEVEFLKTHPTSIKSRLPKQPVLEGLRRCQKKIVLGGRIARHIRTVVDHNQMDMDLFRECQMAIDTAETESARSSRNDLNDCIFYDGITIALHRLFLPNVKSTELSAIQRDCKQRCTRAARRMVDFLEQVASQEKKDKGSVFVSTDYVHFPALYAAVTIHLYDSTTVNAGSESQQYLLRSLRLLYRARALTMDSTPELADED